MSSEFGKKSLEELKAMNRKPLEPPEEEPLAQELRLMATWLAQIDGRLEELNRTLASKQPAEGLRPELAKIVSALEKFSRPPAGKKSGKLFSNWHWSLTLPSAMWLLLIPLGIALWATCWSLATLWQNLSQMFL